MKLKLKPNTLELKQQYSNHSSYHKGDSGLDLFIPDDIVIKPNSMANTIDMKISCEALEMNCLKYIQSVKRIINNYTEQLDDSKEILNNLSKIELEKTNCSYYLYPRSSLSKTPLRMSNSTGIIDAGYRGNIIAKVDNISNDEYRIEKGTRLFQICSPSLEEIELEVVDELSDTTRGSGGFGSTS
tara:strand:+ start:1586 stop:2140 length:555 start_codon:yes stop_codon:yes gene_type:complete